MEAVETANKLSKLRNIVNGRTMKMQIPEKKIPFYKMEKNCFYMQSNNDLNTKNNWILNILDSGILMAIAPILYIPFKHCFPVFKCHLNSGHNFALISNSIWILNNLASQTIYHHWNTWHVCYSYPRCISNVTWQKLYQLS